MNTILCCECNCMCYVEVCNLEVRTIVECYTALLIMVRSGTRIVVVALLVCHASYCVDMLKEVRHGLESWGDI